MPAIRALAVVLTAWVLVLLAPSGPASAGGPTSALLSVPGQARTASLYYTDDAYDQLAGLVDVGASGTVDRSGETHDSGTTVTVTWLIHDVEPWRVDRIYLGADGPWIATQEMAGGATSIWDSPVIWHQPTDGKALIGLLDSLGVGQAGAATGTGAVDEAAAPAEPEPAVPASVEPARGGATGRRRSGHLCSRPRVVGARRAGRRPTARRRLDAPALQPHRPSGRRPGPRRRQGLAGAGVPLVC